ncbi:Glutaredoxin-related protein [Dioscorea alata]|uniref:Glutaredoxin-related protein n=1 Tax=Dioscorea alata TaxID=55571 RepID=A0ACB7W8K5_DIOAL|nr:Glutaredoxin-related protein [Dioscorea alata]
MGCTSSKQARRDRRRSPSPVPRSLSLSGRHIVALTSSTLGSLRLDPITTTTIPDDDPFKLSISLDSLSDMIDLKISRSPSSSPPTPPNEPETINTWELMAGLEDFPEPTWTLPYGQDADVHGSIIADFNLPPTSPETKIPRFTGIVKQRINAFQEKIDAKRSKIAPSSECPPAGQEKVVFYFTSLRGVRKTYEDCSTVRVILNSYNVRLDERDVSMDGGFKDELNQLLGPRFGGNQLPRVFANGVYIGGVEEVRQMHENGELGKVLEGCQPVVVGKGGVAGGVCAACGDVRFVPCEICYGSCKVFVEEEEEEEEEEVAAEDGVEFGGFRRCPECNENGLVRCPVCCLH